MHPRLPERPEAAAWCCCCACWMTLYSSVSSVAGSGLGLGLLENFVDDALGVAVGKKLAPKSVRLGEAAEEFEQSAHRRPDERGARGGRRP